jgi:uncharacterized membrane-anchored protein
MKTGLRIALIIVLQSIALIAMVGMKQYTLSTGTLIVLKTRPIDPRSLFRGDYVRLNYDISSLALNKLEGDKDFQRGDTIYVVVHKDGEFWTAQAAYHRLPKTGPGQVAIKGEVKYAYGNCGANSQDKDCISAQVKYGVENYFVPEGEGRDLERPRSGEVVTIQLAVDRYGNAAIKAVLINGVARYVEKVF